jgi:HK97 family phage portal protein
MMGFLSAFETRSSALSGLEKPSRWLTDAFSSTKSWGGPSVSVNSALQLSAVKACVELLSQTLATVPLMTYERLERGKQRAVNHPLWPLLHDQPNPELDSFHFREAAMFHLLMWGNFYAEIVRNGRGEITALWPLLPWNMMVFRDYVDRELIYRYIIPGGSQVDFKPWQILHVAGFGYDGLVGFSPIQMMMRDTLSIGQSLQEHAGRFFSQGASLNGVIEHPKTLSTEAKKGLKEDIRENYSGLSRSQRIMVLDEGMKYQQASVPPDQAQFLESRKFSIGEIARIFHVPPHLVGDLEKATFSNIEQQGIEFVVHTMMPWFARWEAAILTRCMTPMEQKRFYVEFLADGLLRGDMKSRYDSYAVGRNNGWMSVNEIRERENMNPVDGGDEYLRPLNMVPVGKTDDAGKKDTTDGGNE